MSFDLFQFQNGAIKRQGKKRVQETNDRFQLQNGAIKSVVMAIFLFAISDFNSKMVRLKVNSSNSTTRVNFISIPKWCD